MDNNQIMLAILTTLAMWCTQQTQGSRLLRWGCVLGLCSQPFWFYASISAEQYGEVVVNVCATLIWLRGLWIFWIKPWRAKRKTPINTIVLVQGVNTHESRARNH